MRETTSSKFLKGGNENTFSYRVKAANFSNSRPRFVPTQYELQLFILIRHRHGEFS